MSEDQLALIEAASGESKRADESVTAYVERIAAQFQVDEALAAETAAVLTGEQAAHGDVVDSFCEEIERTTAEPTLADRVEASEDMTAAIQQSTGLVLQYRRILLLVSLVVILVMAILFVTTYLV